jgi:hypothetical protein
MTAALRSARGQKRGPGRSASTSKVRACSAVKKVLSSFGRWLPPRHFSCSCSHGSYFMLPLTGADLAERTFVVGLVL